MKILHLLDIPWWSGLSAYAFDTLEAHRHLGHQVQLAAQKDSLPYKKGKELGWKVFPMGGRHLFASIFNFFKLLFLRERPDLIIIHTGSAHWIGALLSKIWDIPLIRIRVTSQKLKINWFTLVLYQHCKKIVLASENIRTDCLEQLKNLERDKCITLYPAVKGQTKNLNHPDAPFKIGMLARLDPVKGHTYFLKAAKIVQERFPNVEFHFAGAEENIIWGDLLKEIHSLNLNYCFYHGFLRESEVWSYLESCDIGVLSSIGSEEVSRATLEWMAAGKPVVATKVGSITELIQDPLGGFLVPPKDPVSMAQKILEILDNKNLAKKLGAFNLEASKKYYSEISLQQAWDKILSSIRV